MMINSKHLPFLLLASSLLLILNACGGSSSITEPTTQIAATEDFSMFAQVPEVERLRYFKEIGMTGVREEFNLTGKDVRVTIMGEAVDASHPDLQNRINKQFNTFASKGEVLVGKQNQPYGFKKMGLNDGHGTHIAGTIAAECDGVGVQGIACESTIDVYDLGIYDSSSQFELKNWGETHEIARLLTSFSTALDDITQKETSRITTGSFNMESPLLNLHENSALTGQPLSQIIKIAEQTSGIDSLFDGNQVILTDLADKDYLKKLVSNNDDDLSIALGVLLPFSREWKELETAIHNYQQKDGVYIITESNYQLGRTSVLNAMPTISDKVDKDLWLSVVLVQPEGIDEATTIADVDKAIANKKYKTILNHCGKAAAEYCILTPSYSVLSTMTQKVREANLPLYRIENRYHQSYTGHSMGAPMVAAALALMQEKNQNDNLDYSMKDLVRILKQSADRSFPGYDRNKHGQGILDVTSALKEMDK